MLLNQIGSMRQRHSLFKTSIIFAVYWALWHIPLSTIKGYYHPDLVTEGAPYSINFLISIFPFVFLMNRLYYQTDRNVLVAIALHLTANVFNEFFATAPDMNPGSAGLQPGLYPGSSLAGCIKPTGCGFY